MIAGITASTRRGGSGGEFPYSPVRLSLVNQVPPEGGTLEIRKSDTVYGQREGLTRVVFLDEGMTPIGDSSFSESFAEISLMPGTRFVDVYEEFTEDSDNTIIFSGYYGGAIQSVMDWGTCPYAGMSFPDCNDLEMVPDFIPESFTTLTEMFWGCGQFDHPNVGFWDTSNIQTMASVFQGAYSFNVDIGSWDTSNVLAQDLLGEEGMQSMFTSAESFNQDLSGWCVSQFTQEPHRFSFRAESWTLPKPVWGTCPSTDLPSVIGQGFGGGFYAGDIQYPDGQWYKLIVADVSADITGDNSRWKTSNTDTPGTGHLIDGVSNTAAMITADIEMHPAVNHCINHTGGGNSDWYMPAKDELDVIYQNLGFNQPNCPVDFLSGGPQAFASTYYWTSAAYSSSNGWVQLFSDGYQGNDAKSYAGFRVRPVRRIAFTPVLPTVIGEEYGGGYYIGDITVADGGEDDGTYAVIMAGLAGEAPTTLRWKNSNAETSDTDSLTDGMTNTLAMEIAGLEEHPAASYCLSYEGGGNVDWYLPAIDELGLVWTNMALLSILEINPQRYWSSSEQTFNLANLWYFLNGVQEGGLKTNPYYVRPVRRIKRN